MADNKTVKDGGGTDFTLALKDVSSVFYPKHIPHDSSGNYAFGGIATASANFSRPANTTAYASGDLVANSTTAGSVTAMSFTAARISAGGGTILKARLYKTGTSTASASFRLHLFKATVTAANGDNGAFSTSGVADYIGAFDITVSQAFTDGAWGAGTPVSGSDVSFKLASGTTIYGLIEARAAYTPTSGETFTATLEIAQD